MTKRIISLLLISLLLISATVTALPIKAEEQFASGSGTSYDPYIIETAEQLYALQSNYWGGLGYFRLEANIVLNDETFTFEADSGLVKVTDGTHVGYLGTGLAGTADGESTVFDTVASEAGVWYLTNDSTEKGEYAGEIRKWTGLYVESYDFRSIDGNGFTISGLYVNTEGNAGLFGLNYGSSSAYSLTIENAYVCGGESAGGFVGYADYSDFTDCHFSGTVCGKNSVGGIAGSTTVNTSIQLSTVEGTVCGEDFVGGIAGSGSGNVRYCRNYSNVTGGDTVGGIAGEVAQVEDCINLGAVCGRSTVGGIVGKASTVYCGINTGTVGGAANASAVAGDGKTHLQHCYYSALTGSDSNPGATALDEVEMKLQASYEGFDFNYTWYMPESASLPCYLWEADPSFGEKSALWDASVADGFAGGSGTEEDPFLVTNASELAYLAQTVNSEGSEYRGQYVRLEADIHFNDTEKHLWVLNAVPWIPIGGTYRKNDHGNVTGFRGTFDGNGHTISGLYIDNPQEDLQGLFGFLDWGTVSDLTVKDSFIRGQRSVGAIVGGNNGGTVTACLSDATVIGTANVGGIAGSVSNVSNCENSGYVRGFSNVGGVIGYSSNTIGCTNRADATVIGSLSVGGIGGGGSFKNCRNYGDVFGFYEETGGIGGSAYGLINCQNEGNVYGKRLVGGIAGANFGSLNCVNNGDVHGEIAVGGIGGILNGNIHSCINNGNINGDHAVGGILGSVRQLSIHIDSTSTVYLSRNSGMVSAISTVGGIAGDMEGRIEASYNEGTIVGETIVGGIAGTTADPIMRSFNVGTIQNAYSFGPIAGSGSVGSDNYYLDGTISFGEYTYGIERNRMDDSHEMTADEMRDKELFYGFDFVTEFCLSDNASHPTFLWEAKAEHTNALWDGSVAEAFESGDGSEENPFVIMTPAQLALLGAKAEEYGDGHFVLGADIVFNRTEDENWMWSAIPFTPIPTFSGSFDGKGHSIMGLYIRQTEENAALFAINEGSIQNLTLESGVVIGSTTVAGIAAHNTGSVSDCINKATVSGSYRVGGIVGDGSGTAYDCINYGTITAQNNTVGGIAGYSNCVRCQNHGRVSGGHYVGGIAGSDHYGKISFCSNYGSVKGETYVGGIIGEIKGTVDRCANYGYVEATVSAGGIAGTHWNNGSLTSCFSSKVPVAPHSGGVLGYYNSALSKFTLQYCYYVRKNEAQTGTGGSNASFRDSYISVDSQNAGNKAQYTHLSFEGDWVMEEKYPVLSIHHQHLYNCRVKADAYCHTPFDCKTNGVYYYSCLCGAASPTDTFEIYHKEHVAGEWIIDDNGHKKICTVCQETIVNESHKAAEGCNTSCTVCNHPFNNDHVYKYVCTKTSHKSVCQNCGDVAQNKVHSWAEDMISIPATVEEEGLLIHTCTECEYVMIETTPKLPVTEPPQTDTGEDAGADDGTQADQDQNKEPDQDKNESSEQNKAESDAVEKEESSASDTQQPVQNDNTPSDTDDDLHQSDLYTWIIVLIIANCLAVAGIVILTVRKRKKG